MIKLLNNLFIKVMVGGYGNGDMLEHLFLRSLSLTTIMTNLILLSDSIF